MPVLLIGCNHRTSSLDFLERVALAPDLVAKTVRSLVDQTHLSEALVLSTCNRVELYVAAERFHAGFAEGREVLAEITGVPVDELADQIQIAYDDEAVAHLFRVAAGLESAVVGEHEIVGQLKTAWDTSRVNGGAGSLVNQLTRHAIGVAKRARTETGIGRHTASVSQAAVALAEGALGPEPFGADFGPPGGARPQGGPSTVGPVAVPGSSPAVPGSSPAVPGSSPAVPGSSPAVPGSSPDPHHSDRAESEPRVGTTASSSGTLAGRRVLVIGAGDMGRGMVERLAASDAEVTVANRSIDRARALVEPIGGEAASLSGLTDRIVACDVALSGTSAADLVLDVDTVETIMERREGRALLLVDVAVPRDVDPAVARVEGVTLLDMDDIRAFVEESLELRRKETDSVEQIVGEELDRWRADVSAREITPTLVRFRTVAEEMRVAEIARFDGRLAGLDPAQAEAVEALTKSIVAKVLHEPTVRLKAAAGTPRGERLLEALRELLPLEE